MKRVWIMVVGLVLVFGLVACQQPVEEQAAPEKETAVVEEKAVSEKEAPAVEEKVEEHEHKGHETHEEKEAPAAKEEAEKHEHETHE